MQKFTLDRAIFHLQSVRQRPALQLFAGWAVAAVVDRLWLTLDRRVPAWDQADYLTGSLNYWHAFQTPQWLSSEWWTQVWLLSSKIPPLTYIATVPFLNLFGTGFDRATLVNLFLSAVLLWSVYGLGRHLFSQQVGVWAALLCLVFPGLVAVRLDFLLDYPLTAATALAFYSLTLWRDRPESWLRTIAFGLALGIGLAVKQSIVLFLAVPLLWLTLELCVSRQWTKLLQFVVGLGSSSLVCGWWYRTNWLLVLTASKRATVDSAIAEGDPALNTLSAWTYYLQHLPEQVSWLLLAIPIAGFVKWRLSNRSSLSPSPVLPRQSFVWLAVFLLGAYLLCSLNVNKDLRYSLPLLPVLSIALAWGLSAWGWRTRWLTAAVVAVLSVIPLQPTTEFVPAMTQAYVGLPFPHEAAIEEIVRTEPYLQTTLGVLPSTSTVNQHNLNYYGALSNFRVYGRQVGVRSEDVPQDVRSIDWFVTKTGDPGSVPSAYSEIVETVERGGEFALHRQFPLPDGERLNLYHRQQPWVTVTLQDAPGVTEGVALDSVLVPPRVPPGSPVPVTYEWSGSWESLRRSVVLLTWRQQIDEKTIAEPAFWLHDRSIASGLLASKPLQVAERCPKTGILHPDGQSDFDSCTFEISETTAMLPPADLPPGTYVLEARYLDLNTGQAQSIEIPSVAVEVDLSAPIISAPELDWETQLRQLAKALPQGTSALDPVFSEISRINQYDPVQGYLDRAIASLEYRLERDPDRLDWAYTVGLAWVVKKRPDKAISVFERVVALDVNNPYAYAYLAVVNLADWHPIAARNAIETALSIDPSLPELHVLDGIASLMVGNLWRGYRELRLGLSAMAESS
ncbi:MAG: glycosyltransferase family 39 protein [Cyanobacteria bacterium SBC]|nr:glycosyltransferase family 39 protein [Cyanobacteria bacterium SBC]